MDKNLLKYLSTAPVLITAWMSFTAAFIIEIQRYMPDTLSFAARSFVSVWRVFHSVPLAFIIITGLAPPGPERRLPERRSAAGDTLKDLS